MKNIIHNWSLKRSLYLIMGIFFVFTSIKDQFWLMTIVGLYVISMAIFQFGCVSGNCSLERKGKVNSSNGNYPCQGFEP